MRPRGFSIASVLIVLLSAAIVLVSFAPAVLAPPPTPYTTFGMAFDSTGTRFPQGTPIRTFIDGVDYSNKTSVYDNTGSFYVDTFGNWVTQIGQDNTLEVKEVVVGTGERWVIAPTVEYDAFLGGRQYSKLTDTGIGYSDASNRQHDGRGYRAYLMLESGHWAFGPWLHYWKIKDSDIVPIGLGYTAMEPANWTREYGVELRYRF